MNATLAYLYHRACGTWATRPSAIRRHVRADLRAAPPAPGEMFNGLEALLLHARGPTATLGYYLPQTVVAFGLCLIGAVGAWMAASVAEPTLWSRALTLALGLSSAACLYQVARRHGPSLVTRERHAQARAWLERSADLQSPPLGAMGSAALAGLFMLDGILMGGSICYTLAADIFSPRAVAMASALFSIVVAVLLWKLTKCAALEHAQCRRRTLISNLLASPRTEDHTRADSIIASVGDQLDMDFSQRANRVRARVGLAAVVITLSTLMLAIRVNAERAGGADAPVIGSASAFQQ